MRTYTTLGSGSSTKVLAVAPYSAARTVTTCPLEVAKALCVALGRTDRCLAAELYPLAVSLAGTPVAARRTLLNFFDVCCDDRDGVGVGGRPSAGELWVSAERLVAGVADAVKGAPAPVRAAVRAELGEHLCGFDGVLVPARVLLAGRRTLSVDLVISGPLEWLGDQFWSYLLGVHGDLEVLDDDPVHGLGAPLAWSVELANVAQELYDACPASSDYAAWAVSDLFDAADSDSGVAPELLVRADLLLAWVAELRPSDLERASAMLGAHR